MKTLRELYSEALKSEELKKDFTEAVQNNAVEDFLKAHGCEASAEELAAFLREQQAKTGELGDDELDSVSGGCSGVEAAASVITAGIACAILVVASAGSHNMNGPNGEILCANYYDGPM